MKKGELRALRRALLDELQTRFGDLRAEVVPTIKAPTKVKRLQTWIRQFVTADALEDLHIGSAAS